jgi:tetratricopeptide (TPR) repeat protein/tRNA A-37 threonylcarbamoyl transferase component Bud32
MPASLSDSTPPLPDPSPRWNCPRCQRRDIPLPADAAEMASCPSCTLTVAVADLFTPPRFLPQPGGAGATGPELPPAAGRYRPLEFHAEGGLGKVYRAEDTELKREVALKRIKPQLADRPHSRRQFLVEAEITARLEHPGIVPVYGLVTDGTGQPCYAMRFIEGPTLNDALKEFHAADQKGGRDPGERSLAFRKLLHHFIAVCNAMAYAHSRGILHRDLKPSNIMLGKYGETLLVDWGLAKPFERTEAERASGEQTLQPAEDSGPEGATQPGQAKGTPSYMSPEQAAGRLDAMGPASDIFGLGATLYALLTGHAPYAGDRYLALDKARRGKFVPPRQVQRAVPRTLEAICCKAMAVEPADRYATARELGEEVERWLADEPVVGYREPVWARVRRWTRRHKPAVAGATALLVATLLLGGGGLGWFKWQQAAIERAVAEDLREAEQFQERERWPEALQALERAEGRLTGLGSAQLRDQIVRERENVALVRELDEAGLQAATIQGQDFDYAGADRAYAAAFAGHDLDLLALPPEEAAGLLKARSIRARLVTALDDWADVKDHLPGRDGQPLREIARLADIDPWRQQVREPAVRNHLAELERLAQTPSALEQPPATVVLVTRLLNKHKRSGEAERLLRQAQERHPDDFWLNFDLANLLLLDKKPAGSAQAVGYYLAALACRPGTAVVHNNLGVALANQQQLTEAVAAYSRAIELNPDFAAAYDNLGNALAGQHKLAEAIAAYRKAIQVRPDCANAYYNLGVTLHDEHRLPEAVAAYRKAIELNPDDVSAHFNLGNVLAEQQELGEAVAVFRKAIELDPDLAEGHHNLGAALHLQHKLPEAAAAYRKAIAVKPDYVEAYYHLGDVLHDQEQLPEAITAYRKAIALRADWPELHYSLGNALREQEKLPEASASYRRAIALQPDYAEAHCNLGLTLQQQGQLAEGLASLKRGHELGSRRPGWPHAPAAWVRRAERLVQLDAKLPKVRSGEAEPADAAERVALAELCLQPYKQLYAAAARLYGDAFATEPKLAEDLGTGTRYNAACAAALAATGQGKDTAQLDDRERARLRKQALAWLRADLDAWTKKVATGKPEDRALVQKKMEHWQVDVDLAKLRDAAALEKLPPDECAAWGKLWADVRTLREHIAAGK